MTVTADNFNRTDSGTLGLSWGEIEGNLEIVSGTVRLTAGNEFTESKAIWDVDCGSADMYVQCDMVYATDYGNTGMVIRASADHSSMVEVHVNQTALKLEVVRYTSGGYNLIRAGVDGEVGTWGIGTTRTFKLTASGSTYTFYNNGVQQVQWVDTAPTDQRGGIWVGYVPATTAMYIDTWEQGMLNEPVAPPLKPHQFVGGRGRNRGRSNEAVRRGSYW